MAADRRGRSAASPPRASELLLDALARAAPAPTRRRQAASSPRNLPSGDSGLP
jgi:hypothetical protein